MDSEWIEESSVSAGWIKKNEKNKRKINEKRIFSNNEKFMSENEWKRIIRIKLEELDTHRER